MLANHKKLYPYQGKEYTKDEICAITGWSKPSFNRLISERWSIDQIFNSKPRKGKKLWLYNGKEYTIDELCILAGIKERRFYDLISKGWLVDQIINKEYIYHSTMRKTKLYNTYYNMKDRCYNPKHHAYNNYGGRGIYICDEWLSDKTKFFDWALANGYNDNLTIDRIDNNKGYSPDNCRWVDGTIQNSNKRTSLRFKYNNEWLTLNKIAQRENISVRNAYWKYVEYEKTRLPRKYLYE